MMSLYYNVCGVHVGVTCMLFSGIGRPMWYPVFVSVTSLWIQVVLYSSFSAGDVEVRG